MAREVIPPPPLCRPLGLKLIQLWARSLHSIHAIRAVNFCTDASFDEVLMLRQGHPWSSNNPGLQPSLATQRARISPRPSPTEQGAAVGAWSTPQGLQLVAHGGVELPQLPCSSLPRLSCSAVPWESHRPWHHPPGLTSAASQQDPRLPTRVRKAQLHPSSSKQAWPEALPEHAPLCTSAKEVLQRQILNKKFTYSQGNRNFTLLH